MTCAFPIYPSKFQLGAGLDLAWGSSPGFVYDKARGDVVSGDVLAFLTRHAEDFKHLFVSWQPRDRAHLDAKDYFPAYDDLFVRLGSYEVRALHHTALNLAAIEPYERGALLAMTNALAKRYALRWVNEDL